MGKNKNKKPKEVAETEEETPVTGADEESETETEGDDADAEAEGELPPEVVKPALAQSEANEAKRQADPMVEAHKHLDGLLKFCKGKKEEHLLRDHGINRVHSGLFLEMGENKAKGKLNHFSDGHREMLKINYDKLVKAGKIKE